MSMWVSREISTSILKKNVQYHLSCSYRQQHTGGERLSGSLDILPLWIDACVENGKSEVLPEQNFPSIIAGRRMFKTREAQLTMQHPFVLSFIMVFALIGYRKWMWAVRGKILGGKKERLCVWGSRGEKRQWQAGSLEKLELTVIEEQKGEEQIATVCPDWQTKEWD